MPRQNQNIMKTTSFRKVQFVTSEREKTTMSDELSKDWAFFDNSLSLSCK